MGIVIRQSIYSTIISYAGIVIGYVNLLYLYPKFLEPDQVGLLRTIQDAAILFAPFAQFGLAQGIFRYYPALVKDDASKSRFVSAILLLGLAGFGIFVLVFQLFKAPITGYFNENAHEVISYSGSILWLTLILVLTAVLESYSRSLLLTVVPNLLREVVIRLLLAGMVVLYILNVISYEFFIYGTVIGYLLCLFALIFYLSRQGHFRITFDLTLLKSEAFPEIIRYTLLSFAGSAAIIVIGKIDSMMVAGLSGLTAVAIYTNAFYMATVIEIPKRALSQLAYPLIARAFEKEDLKEIQTIYSKTSINQLIIGALLLIGVYANLLNIFQLMPRHDVYEAGKWVVIIIGVGKMLDMLFGPSSEIIVLSRYYWFNMILTILLALGVITLNNLLIPQYGINGAAIGAAISLALFNLVKFIFIYWKLKMQPFSSATVKVLFISLTTLALNSLLPSFENVFIDIIVRSGIITIFYSSLILAVNASPDGNALLLQLMKRFKPKS